MGEGSSDQASAVFSGVGFHEGRPLQVRLRGLQDWWWRREGIRRSEVDPGGVEGVFLKVQGEEEMVALCFDLTVGKAGAWGNDACEFAFDEFAGFSGFDLVADRNFDALVEQFLDVIIGGVVGDACHRHARGDR